MSRNQTSMRPYTNWKLVFRLVFRFVMISHLNFTKVYLTHFMSLVSSLHLLENIRKLETFFWLFMGYKKWLVAWNRLICAIVARLRSTAYSMRTHNKNVIHAPKVYLACDYDIPYLQTMFTRHAFCIQPDLLRRQIDLLESFLSKI